MMTYQPRAPRALLAVLAVLLVSACDLTADNPNNPTEDDVFGTRAGLTEAAVGLQFLYNADALGSIVLTPGITTREIAADRTFENLRRLESAGSGDSELTPDNTNVTALFVDLTQVLGQAERLVEGARTVETVTGDFEDALVGLGLFYQAAAIGALAQSFTAVPLATDEDGLATYTDRTAALADAVTRLDEAESLLADGAADALGDVTPPEFDLLASVRAYKARFALFAGDYDTALAAANSVAAGATSFFVYTDLAPNPIHEAFFEGTPSYVPRDDLGLEEVEEGDARLDFYLVPLERLSATDNALPVDSLAGYFFGEASPLPVFLQSELDLIRAEALVRQGNLGDAVDAINEVRTKAPEESPFGIGADLDEYAGPVTEQALLDEIYYQRAVELYLQGLRLEDARRLDQPGPSGSFFERNRNFYPFPQQERIRNPDNVPEDPGI